MFRILTPLGWVLAACAFSWIAALVATVAFVLGAHR